MLLTHQYYYAKFKLAEIRQFVVAKIAARYFHLANEIDFANYSLGRGTNLKIMIKGNQ